MIVHGGHDVGRPAKIAVAGGTALPLQAISVNAPPEQGDHGAQLAGSPVNRKRCNSANRALETYQGDVKIVPVAAPPRMPDNLGNRVGNSIDQQGIALVQVRGTMRHCQQVRLVDQCSGAVIRLEERDQGGVIGTRNNVI